MPSGGGGPPPAFIAPIDPATGQPATLDRGGAAPGSGPLTTQGLGGGATPAGAVGLSDIIDVPAFNPASTARLTDPFGGVHNVPVFGDTANLRRDFPGGDSAGFVAGAGRSLQPSFFEDALSLSRGLKRSKSDPSFFEDPRAKTRTLLTGRLERQRRTRTGVAIDRLSQPSTLG